MVRENNYVEACKSLRANQARLESAAQQRVNDYLAMQESIRNKSISIREAREMRERMHSKLLESARNDALATALKAIYITALEANTLTDDAIVLAESLVDEWIKEKGGASKILREKCNDTYFLARLYQIVEDAAQDEVEKIESTDGDEEGAKEEAKDKPVDTKDAEVKEDKKEESSDEEKKEEDKPADEEKKEEESSEEKKEEDKPAEEDKKEDKPEINIKDDEPEEIKELESEDEESSEDDNEIETLEVDPNEHPNEDDDVTDALGEPIDEPGDEDNMDLSIDGEAENKGKIFEDLDKEKDVKRAVELIRQRIADAEETFIKNNAEDKKQIDDLLSKISDNVKTVENMGDDDSTESKIAKESVSMCKRKIDNITESRPLTILEKMTRNLNSSILKDEAVKEQYLNENGSMDISSVVESAKVMYGFMETLNTLKLEKVNCDYLSNVLKNM